LGFKPNKMCEDFTLTSATKIGWFLPAQNGGSPWDRTMGIEPNDILRDSYKQLKWGSTVTNQKTISLGKTWIEPANAGTKQKKQE
jgi:hypothetical protein